MASALRATACFLETLELLPDVPTVRDCQRDADELANIVDSLCDEVAADERHPLNRFGDGVDGGRGYSADAGWGRRCTEFARTGTTAASSLHGCAWSDRALKVMCAILPPKGA